jgi:hypothetical protein
VRNASEPPTIHIKVTTQTATPESTAAVNSINDNYYYGSSIRRSLDQEKVSSLRRRRGSVPITKGKKATDRTGRMVFDPRRKAHSKRLEGKKLYGRNGVFPQGRRNCRRGRTSSRYVKTLYGAEETWCWRMVQMSQPYFYLIINRFAPGRLPKCFHRDLDPFHRRLE